MCVCVLVGEKYAKASSAKNFKLLSWIVMEDGKKGSNRTSKSGAMNVIVKADIAILCSEWQCACMN